MHLPVFLRLQFFDDLPASNKKKVAKRHPCLTLLDLLQANSRKRQGKQLFLDFDLSKHPRQTKLNISVHSYITLLIRTPKWAFPIYINQYKIERGRKTKLLEPKPEQFIQFLLDVL